MMTVAEVSRAAGISVRTLHHYDAIGLLRPAQLSEAGYRLYDDAALRRLQTILLLREMQFPLREIRAILDSPQFDPQQALRDQIHLLEMRRDRLNAIIAMAREIEQKGVTAVSFAAFDQNGIDRYADEAKARWKGTAAWAEYEKRPSQGHEAAGRALMELLASTAALRPLPADDPAVQQQIAALQAHISRSFYPCTDEILSGLGEMYVADGRFRENIDAAAGESAAEFIRAAIRIFIAGKK